MKFRTIAELPPKRFALQPDNKVLLSGSCFTSAIGRQLQDAMPCGHVMTNPFGILYNPYSIVKTLSLLTEEDAFPSEYIYKGADALWHSHLHSGEFSASSKPQCEELINNKFKHSKSLLSSADLVVLTWGTADVYRLKENGLIVGNCHKEPSTRFEVDRLSVDEIVTQYECLLNRLKEIRPSINVLLTVSPYRYLKNGLHANTLGKSVLHLAAEQLTKHFEFVSYFPAYEIVIDELRDYRYFERDMQHPSAQASDYVWERFSEWCFTDQLREYAHDKTSVLEALRHRPLHPEGVAYEKFQMALREKQEQFNKKWSWPLRMEEDNI